MVFVMFKNGMVLKFCVGKNVFKNLFCVCYGVFVFSFDASTAF